MKSLSWKLCLAAGVSCLALFGAATTALSSEGVPVASDERLQRMEQRFNDLADRQEHAIRLLEAAAASREQIQPQPGASLGTIAPAPAPVPQTVRPPDPPAEGRGAVAVRILRGIADVMRLAFLGFLFSNLLLAIWIFSDIRKRGEGSGIFVALALVAGIPAAIIYSLVRIGDKLAAGGK